MNKFEQELLKSAYDNYIETNLNYCNFQMKNGHDFLYYHTAAQNLVKEGLINPLSDNIMTDSVSIFNFLLEFEITPLGLFYVETNLKG